MYPRSATAQTLPAHAAVPTTPEANVVGQTGPIRFRRANRSATARPALQRRDAFSPEAPLLRESLSAVGAAPLLPTPAVTPPTLDPLNPSFADPLPRQTSVVTPTGTPARLEAGPAVAAFWADASAFLPLVSSPLADLAAARPSTSALLRGGDALYLANPGQKRAAIHCWLLALVGASQQKVQLFEELSRELAGNSAPRQTALNFFHVACLMSDAAGAQQVFRFAQSILPDTQALLEQMLAQAKKQRAFAGAMGGVHWHLQRNLGVMVGKPAAEQKSLSTALCSGDFARANALSERMEKSLPDLPLVHWARFICDFETFRGMVPLGGSLTTKSKFAFWARGILFTAMSFDKSKQDLAQGALDVVTFRTVWQLFLERYFAVSPQDFAAPAGEVSALGLSGKAARKLGGIYWNDLLAVPFPHPWGQYRSELDARNAEKVGRSTALANLRLDRSAAQRRMVLD